MFDREIDDDVLVIRHMPGTKSHHISVGYCFGAFPFGKEKKKKKVWLDCATILYIQTMAFLTYYSGEKFI